MFILNSVNFIFKEKPAVRAEAFTLFGNLSRFGDGPSKGPFLEQIQANFISLLIDMNEEPAVTKVTIS